MITGFHENQAELSNTFAEAFTVIIANSTSSIIKDKVKDNKANPFYGESREVDKIKLDFRNKKEEVSVYCGVKPIDPRGEISIASGSVVLEGKLLLNVFATYGKRAIVFCEQLLKESGYITENGALGKPPEAPWDFGNIKVIRFDPVGGFNSHVVEFADMFVNQQLIDFAIYDKNIADV